MRIVAMALTAVGTAIASPVHITYYQKLMETNNTIEIVFSAILLLIYLDVFTLSVSLLYLNRKTKSSFFWITLVGGLFLFLGGDVFYRYSISLESYIYGTYPDTIFNLAYSVFLIGMIFLSQRQDDVTSVLEVIEERKHYQNLYLELNNLATDLLNVTSLFHHDLINDLSFIQSSLDIYQDTKKTKMLDNIQKRLDTVAQKIRNLNTSSDVLKSLRTQSIEVNSISDVVLSFDNVSYIPATENVKIEFSNLLSSILINLIQNSFQHGGNGILVQVETTFDEQSVFIKVKDNGIGISDEDKKKVFKKEFRKSDKGVGGIGLFLIENLVQRFEGKIYFEDNIPQGTIVTVELPRCD